MLNLMDRTWILSMRIPSFKNPTGCPTDERERPVKCQGQEKWVYGEAYIDIYII